MCVHSQLPVPSASPPAVSSDGSVRLWDCGSAKCLATITNTHCPINACAVASSTTLANQNTAPPTGKDAVFECVNTTMKKTYAPLALLPGPAQISVTYIQYGKAGEGLVCFLM